ncbi:ribonuclease H-like domain-containing protein [Mycena maculata]|uniref:DNA polymerase delta catalytic subunit n=1 Tax=Mycena maculata TaxID=230809 RepID=A0AAD7JAE2_9AGAR|nr:ribonuclease H-like domain-containing protein [Mycena maculata]
MIFHAPEGDWTKSAPLRILSFDLETAIAPPSTFSGDRLPRYSHEAVFQIGNTLLDKVPGEFDSYAQFMFTLNTCSDIDGVEVKSYDTESELLLAWRDFVIESDPDVIIGHNISRFDWPHLLLRSEFALALPEFSCIGRLQGVHATARPLPLNQRKFNDGPILMGRLQLDTNQYMAESQALRRNFTIGGRPRCDLNTLAAEFLDDKKGDVHFLEIEHLQHGGADTRRKLAVYCLKDTELPLKLLNCRLQCLDEAIRAARANTRYMYRPFHEFLRNGRNRS